MSLEKHYRMIISITSWKSWFVQSSGSLHYSIWLSALDVCMHMCMYVRVEFPDDNKQEILEPKIFIFFLVYL